jgi:hypothetical protein
MMNTKTKTEQTAADAPEVPRYLGQHVEHAESERRKQIAYARERQKALGNADARKAPRDNYDIMRASALQDARVKRWEGWTWKDYQASIVRQNYALADRRFTTEEEIKIIAARAERLAEALKQVTDEFSTCVDNWKDGCETHMDTETWNEYTMIVVKCQDALAAWKERGQ